MSAKDEVEQLAQLLYEARRELRNAGRILHDEIGPLLSAAGLRVQLLRMDWTQSSEEPTEALAILDQAMERVRALSQNLNSSPAAHIGLEKALFQLVARHSESFPGILSLSYTAGRLPPEVCVEIYDTLAAALEQTLANGSATRISISVSGKRTITARMSSNRPVKWPRRTQAAWSRRLRPAGISLEITTKKGTIVSIQYAAGRPPGG